MDILLQLVVNGLLLGGTYAIISIGLTLIFGIVRVVNFAHGELLMVGMYATFLLVRSLGISSYAAAAPVVLLLFVVGMGLQRFVIQPLLSSDPHIQIFAMVGVSTALMNLALLVFGGDLLSITSPTARTLIRVGPVTLVLGQVISFLSAIVLIGALYVFLHRTFLGRAIRATAQNRYAAPLMGVDVNRVYIITFGIGAACVGLAAVLILPIYPVFPTVGGYFVLAAFVIVVLGGMGSLMGAFFAAMIIGLVDSFSGYFIAPDLKEVVYFVMFVLILVLRPTGLFGLGRGSE